MPPGLAEQLAQISKLAMNEQKKVLSAAEVRGMIFNLAQDPELLAEMAPEQQRPRKNTRSIRRNTRTIRRNTKTIRRDMNANGMAASELMAILDGVKAPPDPNEAREKLESETAAHAGNIIRPAPRTLNSSGVKAADLLNVLGSGPLTDVTPEPAVERNETPSGSFRPRRNTRMIRRGMQGGGLSREELLKAIETGTEPTFGVSTPRPSAVMPNEVEDDNGPIDHKNPLVRAILARKNDFAFVFETIDGVVYLGVANDAILRVSQAPNGQLETMLYRHFFFVDKDVCHEIKGRTISMESPTWIVGEEIVALPLRPELHPILFGREGARKIRFQLKGEEVKRIKIFGDEDADLPGGLLCGNTITRVYKGIPPAKIIERSAV